MNDKKNAGTFVSTNIKHLRTINGKTQQDIADLCEKQNTAVANWSISLFAFLPYSLYSKIVSFSLFRLFI